MKNNALRERLQVEFSIRVNAALDNIGFPAKHEGRQTALAAKLGVDQKAVHKWLEGKGFPHDENMTELAKLVGESKSYLRFNEGQPARNASNDNYVTHHTDSVNLSDLSVDPSFSLGALPLVSLSEIGRSVEDSLANTETNYSVDPAKSPVLGRSVVEGSTMTREIAPSFPSGCEIFWIKAESAETGDFVVAVLPDGSRTFRELDKDGDNLVLRPLNNQYPVIAGSFRIVAVVTGKYEAISNSVA